MKEMSAGGVVYRRKNNRVEIQMIQDRFGKMTLPKGKMEKGETAEQTALREILEETGLEGSIVCPIEKTTYQFQHPQSGTIDKEVQYYLVEAIGGRQKAQIEEINGAEWYTPEQVWEQQIRSGYDNNQSVLHRALTVLGCEVHPR